MVLEQMESYMYEKVNIQLKNNSVKICSCFLNAFQYSWNILFIKISIKHKKYNWQKFLFKRSEITFYKRFFLSVTYKAIKTFITKMFRNRQRSPCLLWKLSADYKISNRILVTLSLLLTWVTTMINSTHRLGNYKVLRLWIRD